jgi:hypothetical protein
MQRRAVASRTSSRLRRSLRPCGAALLQRRYGRRPADFVVSRKCLIVFATL